MKERRPRKSNPIEFDAVSMETKRKINNCLPLPQHTRLLFVIFSDNFVRSLRNVGDVTYLDKRVENEAYARERESERERERERERRTDT